MPIVMWRRHHGAHLVAHVTETQPGHDAVTVWREPTGAVRRLPKPFTRLESAKAAADDFVRQAFHHACRLEDCGTWLLWPG
jgi:hypothetical protein